MSEPGSAKVPERDDERTTAGGAPPSSGTPAGTPSPVPPSSAGPDEPRTLGGPDTQPTLPLPAEAVRAAEAGTAGGPVTPAQARANAAAFRILRRLVTAENPPTAPLSIVDRLAGSPYANPTIQVGGVDESDRRILDFALLLAETMFRYGAGALEVEASMIAVTAALGLKHVEVDITNQSVSINYAPRDQTPITLLRVVRSWTSNYAGLVLVHRLVSEIATGGVGRDEAMRRLQGITKRAKPFPKWAVTTAYSLFAALFVGVLGGGLMASLIAFLSNFAVSLVFRILGGWRVPDFFSTLAGAFLVTLSALLVYWASVPIAPAIVVVGGILPLLPTQRLVSATQDAINGFPVTAAGRYLSAFLTFAALVAGIAVAFLAGELLGVARIDVTQTYPAAYPYWAQVLLIGFSIAAIAVTEQTARRLVVPTALVGVAGYLALTGVQLVGVGDRIAPAASAVVIGFLARIVALRMGAPQLVVAVPAALILLPGLTIFRSMYVATLDAAQITQGAGGMLTAMAIILGAAAGIVLGDNLARPFTRGGAAVERRRRNVRR
ncbi:threonine/serine exporter family protein [Sinomonas sp. ASV322]|uniref:threonine/serine ThrE exporter family protein n=1 Tax=Sinomonas sp. ASV322 TaxID=3041920 RepID=UPI0027DE75BF|nr:threonine/serine exporter family protein [Sinomonas sp. ASV322]MDQ4504607.1 threonine/serine exporter family protein [Sinomonas sp. ASV322]